ncbi:MAG: S-adenosylmethionine:tRNA ribosyltransferase-isomerase, partial [Pseudomonadota bacterium]
MQLSDFDFHLPDELIATRPARPRSSARMLVVDGAGLHDDGVTGLVRWLRPGDRLVLNDTKVIPARLQGERVRETTDGSGRAAVEFTLIEPHPDGTWKALGRPLRKLREGDRIEFGTALRARVVRRDDEAVVLSFDSGDKDLQDVL